MPDTEHKSKLRTLVGWGFRTAWWIGIFLFLFVLLWFADAC